MMTCQPIAVYFSWELLRSRFQKACSEADKRRRTTARMGIQSVNVS
jgi:hypothetical protein